MINKLRKLAIAGTICGAVAVGSSAAFAQSHNGGRDGGSHGGTQGNFHGGGYYGGGGFRGGGFGVFVGPGYAPLWGGYGYYPGYYGEPYYAGGYYNGYAPYAYNPYAGYAPNSGYVPPPDVTMRPQYATPSAQSSVDETNCRDYQTTAVVDGHSQRVTGVACLQPNGSWRIVR